MLGEGVGQLTDVGAFPLDHEFGRASLALRHGTGLASVFVGRSRRETFGLKKPGDLLLDCVGCERGDVAGEVFDREEKALIFGDGDADNIEFGIEKIGAMGRGGHPNLLNGGGSVSMTGDILGDGAKAGSSVGAASDQVGLAGILVEELSGVADNPLEMEMGGVREGVVPLQGRQIVGGAGLIGELQERLLG